MFKKQFQKLKKDQKGLTLVELLAVVVILAIVAAIAFVVIGNVIDNTRKDAHVSNALQIIASAKVYESTGGKIGTGIKVSDLQDDKLLGKLQDPWKANSSSYAETPPSTLTVSKTNGEFQINNFIGEGCTLTTATETQLNKQGRKLCDPAPDPEPKPEPKPE